MTRITRVVLLALASAALYGQSADPALTFEVASIKPAVPGPGLHGCYGGPGSKDPAVYHCSKASVAAMVFQAFNLKSYQLAPLDLTDPAIFDVVGKVPEGATAEQTKVMLQNLLLERFKLAYHYDKKEMPTYDLVVAKGGPKLKESVPPAEGAAVATKPVRDDDGFVYIPMRNSFQVARGNGLTRWVSNNMPISALASWLGQVGRPVTESTGLTGKYDFILTFTSDSLAGTGSAVTGLADSDGGLPIFAALEKQLGLKLESKKSMIDIFVIDHAEKSPTEN